MDIKFLLIVTLCFVSADLLARTDDRDQPIHITADTAELNDKTGISIYRGDVVMIQGTTTLTGDVVTIHSKDNQVNKVISVGALATYEETTDDGDEIYAEAEEMVYNRLESKIDLYRKAKVTEEDNIFRSEHIRYFIEEELIEAGNPSVEKSDKKERVNMTIIPDSNIFNKDEQQ